MSVNTNQAVKKLRGELKLSQEALAQRLGATLKTISRYENGQKPSGKFLEALIALSREAGRADLEEFFSRQKRKQLDASLKRLQSEGTARPIPYWQLDAISKDIIDVDEAFDNIESLIPNKGTPGEIKQQIRKKLQRVLDALYPWLSRDERFLRGHKKRIDEEMPF